MGREGSNDPTVHSSIALLQERFRQLQRVKEMREEKKLMRPHNELERASPGVRSEQPKWFFHPELVHPPRPLQGPKSVQQESTSTSTEFPTFGTSLSMSLWPDRPIMHNLNGSNEMDVDTSLHL